MSNENNDKLSKDPSITDMNEQLNDMSAEEFQRSFYAWFEDNGIVAELRKHLRRQMVQCLRNTNLGVAVSQMHLTASLKTQLINLLIGEYLVKMNYLFSLSVYSTEVPFISVFPECRLWLSERQPMNLNAKHFTEEKLREIFEVLGFSTQSEIFKRVTNLYFHSEESNPLITCVIRVLSDLSKQKLNYNSTEETNVAALNYEFLMTLEPWLKEVYTLLSNFEIPSNILYDILTHLRNIFVKEHDKVKLTETTNFNLLQAQIQKDLQKKEVEIGKIITELEQTFYEEKQKMLEDFAKEQSEVSTTIENALKREAEYKKMLHSLEEREVVIEQREKEVNEELETLKSRVKLLQEAYDSVVVQNVKLNSMKGHNGGDMLYDNDSRELLLLEYEHLRREIKATKDVLQQFNRALTMTKTIRGDSLKAADPFVPKAVAERLRNENAQLKGKNQLLQARVEELTNTNNELTRELDIALRTAELLATGQKSPGNLRSIKADLEKEVEQLRKSSDYLVRELEDNVNTVKSLISKVVTVPPEAPESTGLASNPEVPPTPAPRQSVNKGGGETTGAQPRTQSQSVANATEYRRTVPSRLIVHSDSDTGSHTPTDEVLQEARTRLRSLERATAEVENSYRAFRQRQLCSGFANQELTNKIRESTLRNHILAQFTQVQPDPNVKNALDPGTSSQTDAVFPLPKLNLVNYYTAPANENGASRYQMNKETSTANCQVSCSAATNAGNYCHIFANRDTDVNLPRSSSDNRSSPANSVDSSGLNLPVHNLSISSIDISSDYVDGAQQKSPAIE